MRLILALGLAHALFVSPVNGSIRMDYFSDGTTPLSVDAGAMGMSVDPITGLEFATRKVIVDFTGSSGAISPATTSSSSGLLEIYTGTASAGPGPKIILEYSALQPIDLSIVDVDDSSILSFLIDMRYKVDRRVPFDITLSSAGGAETWTSSTRFLETHLTGPSEGSMPRFRNSGYGLSDVPSSVASSVETIRFEFDPPLNTNIALDYTVFVPEHSSMIAWLLIAVSVMGIGLVRRRRRNGGAISAMG